MTVIPPDELYVLAADLPDLRGTVLVEMLDGFVDAGAARRIARNHLLASGPGLVVATFDVDLLFDYRARRPPMVFVEDHWQSYDTPRLDIRMCNDAAGTAYLLLSGPEPDVMWDRFATAVTQIVDHLGVRLTIGTNAIPMAVPHTRPVGVTPHGSRPDLFGEHPRWVGTVQVPGSASAMLEHRLATTGHDALGFAVHVPHYLSQADYPPAAQTLLGTIAAAGGLVIPVDALNEASRDAQSTITSLVDQSDELAEMVRTLEAQYDAYLASREGLPPDLSSLPSADELAAELERFLAEQTRKPDDPSA